MATITRIRASRRAEGGCVISIDGKVALTLSDDMAEQLDLREGLVVDDALRDRLEQARQFDLARRAALQRLNRRALTSRDLARKLREKQFASDTIEQVIADLAERGLINDAQYAQVFAESQVRRKSAGKRLLVSKLREKGIDASTAEQAAASALEDVDQVAAARALAEKKLQTLHRYDAATKKRRVWSLLQRRGFDSDVIQQALGDMPFNDEENVQ